MTELKCEGCGYYGNYCDGDSPSCKENEKNDRT